MLRVVAAAAERGGVRLPVGVALIPPRRAGVLVRRVAIPFRLGAGLRVLPAESAAIAQRPDRTSAKSRRPLRDAIRVFRWATARPRTGLLDIALGSSDSLAA